MTAPKFVTDFVNYMFKNYSQDAGKLLVHMGALGTVFAAISQLCVVAFDKSIDKKKKKFLLPQEAADAAVNIFMFYTVCDLVKKGSDKIVEKGALLTKEVADAIKAIKPGAASWKDVFTKAELKTKLTELLSNPSRLNVFNGNITPAQQQKVADALAKLEKHKNNCGVVAAIAASVVAGNIITPYLRNSFAAKYQKHQIYKDAVKTRKCQIKENITMRNPLPHSFKAFNNYNSFSGIQI